MIKQESYSNFDTEEIVRTYTATPNPETKEKAIKANLPLVKHIVGRLNIPEQGVLRKEDLYQYGIIGLIDALDRYKEEYGVKFKTFAYRRIFGEIMDAVRKLGILNREQMKCVNKILNAIDDLRNQFGREPTVHEVCQYADITPEEYYTAEQLNNLSFTLSLNDRVYENTDGTVLRQDLIADENQDSPEQLFERQELKNQLKALIKRLPEKQRLVLALYYYEELTLMDIGQVLGLSESRVSQILKQTIIDIRRQIRVTL
jgi:RNA polymerase sigma factor for flagellar operon FliA